MCAHRQTLQWHHNECYGVSNHRRLDYLLNCLFRRRSKKTSKLRVTGLCEGNALVTCGFPSQKASHAENVSMWWRNRVMGFMYDNNLGLLFCISQFYDNSSAWTKPIGNRQMNNQIKPQEAGDILLIRSCISGLWEVHINQNVFTKPILSLMDNPDTFQRTPL